MLLRPHEEFVMKADARPTDKPQCALYPNEKADNHEDAEELEVVGVGGVAIEADSGDQLDHEHNRRRRVRPGWHAFDAEHFPRPLIRDGAVG